MKILCDRHKGECGQIMGEACIGLSLMTFAWILISYCLYMANNQIRTEMAARYAAWYTGNNGGTLPSTTQIDQYFFFQSGLSSVKTITPPVTLSDILSQMTGGLIPSQYLSFLDLSDGTSANGPFKVQVSYGVSDPSVSTNPFPFSVLQAQVPFMPKTTLPIYSVNSTCQWDGDGDTWNSFSAMWGLIKNALSNIPGIGPYISDVLNLFGQ
jgi:hypothetical protein